YKIFSLLVIPIPNSAMLHFLHKSNVCLTVLSSLNKSAILLLSTIVGTGNKLNGEENAFENPSTKMLEPVDVEFIAIPPFNCINSTLEKDFLLNCVATYPSVVPQETPTKSPSLIIANK